MSFYLSASRVLVRPLHQGDAESLLALVSSSSDATLSHLQWMKDYSIKDAELFIADGQRAWQQSAPRSLPLAIIARDSMALVGVADVHDCCWLRAVGSLGIWLAEHARGLGYATQACQLMARIAMDRWHFKQLKWMHGVDNHDSARLAKRLGFDPLDDCSLDTHANNVVYAKALHACTDVGLAVMSC